MELRKPLMFDLGGAHELYKLLLGPVESLIKDKRHLLIVPTGALTALPFHLLVTEKPAVAVPDRKDLRPYREAAWLLKRQAVSVLPSVASLKGLRAFAGHAKAPKPMIGFGDPVFHPGPAGGARGAQQGRQEDARLHRALAGRGHRPGPVGPASRAAARHRG